MASIGNDGNGRKRILFFGPDGSRKTLRLGKCDLRTAEGVRRMVEFLATGKISNQPIPVEVATWVNSTSAELKAKLARCGLIESQDQQALGIQVLKVFLESQVMNRQDVKPASKTVWSQSCRNLLEYFGGDRDINSITAGDAKAFKEWLAATPNKRNREDTRLSQATVAKRIKLSRQFFERAVDLELIQKNPFKKVKAAGSSFSREKANISRETMDLLMRIADPVWQGILALARYGGLRTPSETLSLKWSQVHWDKNQVLVPSCKTEHHPGKDFRVIPLFPELVAPLRNLQELAPAGGEYVIPGDHRSKAIGPRGWQNINLRQAFRRLCIKAGLKPIPEAFKAMRATRATELCESWPVKTVVSWMGHDVKVLLRHYAQVPQEHFERACGTTFSGEKKSGTESGTVMAHFPAQQEDAGNRQEDEKVIVNPEAGSFFASSCLSQLVDTKGLNGPEGI